MRPVALALILGDQPTWDAITESLRDLPVRIVLAQIGKPEWSDLASRLKEACADLAIVDVSAVHSVADTFRLMRSLPQPPVIAAVHNEPAPDVILEAVRAGAADFLCPPFDVSVPKAFERISAGRPNEEAPTRTGGRVLGFVSAKGGCGATTIASHLALELPRQTNSKVLLADLDFEAGLIAFLCKTRSEYSVSDALSNLHRLDLSFWKKIISNGHPGLEIITAPSQPSEAGLPGSESLAEIITFARRHYDWTLLDLGRGISESRLRIFESVDEVFLVTTMEVPALHLAKMTTRRLLGAGMRPQDLRIIVNRIGTPETADLTLKELERALGHDIFATVPNEYAPLQDSYAEGRLLGEDTRIRRQLSTVARRIAGLPEQKPKRRFALFG